MKLRAFKDNIGAFAIATGILLSRVSGLIRERVFAHCFGNTWVADAIRSAYRIPNFLQNLLGEGALSASFIPVYSQLLAKGETLAARKLAHIVLTAILCLVFTLTALGMLAAPAITHLFAPGFTGATLALTIHLVRIFFVGISFLVFSAWCLGILNSHRYFLLPYVVPALSNIIVISALLIAHKDNLLTLADIFAWGTSFGSFIMLLVQLPTIKKLLQSIRLNTDFQFPIAKNVFRNFLPAFLARGVVQLSAFIDNIIASFLAPGSVAALSYAQTLYVLPVSLFGISISQAELPLLSSEVADDAKQKITARVNAGLKRMAFWIIPCVAGFVFLGNVIVAAIYQTGKFDADETLRVWIILAAASVGLLASTLGRLYSTTFYALKNTRTPLKFALLRLVLTTLLGILFAIYLSHYFHWENFAVAGLSMSAGLSGWCEFFLLQRALRKILPDVGLSKGIFFRYWGLALFALAIALGIEKIAPLHPLGRALLVLPGFAGVYLGFASMLRYTALI